MTISTETLRPADRAPARSGHISPYLWVWVGNVLLYGAMLLVSPNQASIASIGAALPYVGMLALASLGQALVVMQRGIDFSVVGILLMSGMVIGTLTKAGWDLVQAAVVTLLAGAIAGFVNGLVVVFLRITPLVATLATNGLFLGFSLILSNGAPVKMTPELHDFSRSNVLGVSTVFIISLVGLAVAALLLRKTSGGRRFTAVGANPKAAHAAGISVDFWMLLAYSLAGLLYAAAGILLAAHIGDSRMTSGADYLMASVAAVVLGGTSLSGGRGSLLATFGGAIFMTFLTQLVLGLGAPASIQLLVQAFVLIVAVTLPNAIGALRRRPRGRTAARASLT